MLISFLCLSFAAMAQTEPVTDLAQLSNDKVYCLTSERAFLLNSSAQGVSGQICSSTGKLVGTVTKDPTDPNQQFKIEKVGTSYYLYSVGAAKYVNANGNYEATATSPLTIEKVNNDSYPWKLCIGGNGMNSQEQGQMDAGIVVNSWTTTDAGNCYAIEGVILEARPISVIVLGTEDETAGVIYNEQEYNASRGPSPLL